MRTATPEPIGCQLAKAPRTGRAEMSVTEDQVNKGVILRPGAARPAGTEKTFIVSGLGRGGTSLAASILFHAGIYMGHHLAEAVYEDLEFTEAFHARNRDLLMRLIASRNTTHRMWGFKTPHIHAVLGYQDIGLFRNPHLIVIFRDPVAVAGRSALAEYLDPLTAMRECLDGLKNLVGFVDNTTAPALLLSYEKALLKPEHFIDAVTRFCGIALDQEQRQSLLKVVQPDAEVYIRTARRRFVGRVEHILDHVLHGWCWEVGSLLPIELDCYAGDEKILTFKAAEFRPDLLEARYANGNHGFSLDLRRFNIDPQQTLEVRVAGRDFLLPGSGLTLREYERR
jgi:hypothetical protein